MMGVLLSINCKDRRITKGLFLWVEKPAKTDFERGYHRQVIPSQKTPQPV